MLISADCEGPSTSVPGTGSTLSLTQLWDKEEEEGVADIPMMDATETITVEDLMVTIEDIFEDLNLDGQTNTACPEAVKGERVELEATVTEEAAVDIGQGEEAQAEGVLPEEYPTTPMATRPSPLPDISPAQKAHHCCLVIMPVVVCKGCPEADGSSER